MMMKRDDDGLQLCNLYTTGVKNNCDSFNDIQWFYCYNMRNKTKNKSDGNKLKTVMVKSQTYPIKMP